MKLSQRGASSAHQSDGPSRRNTGPTATTVNTILAEDTVRTRGTISMLPGGPVALFANPVREGAEELFVLDADRNLTYVHRAPEGNGWVQEIVDHGTGQAVADLVAAVHPDGAVWLFVAYGSAEGQLASFRLDQDGSWRSLPIDANTFGWRYLSVHYLPDRPATPCVVGVNAQRSELQVLLPRIGGSEDSAPWATELDVSLTSPLPAVSHAALQLDGTLRIYAFDNGVLTRRTYSGSWEPDVPVPGAESGARELAGLWNAPDGLGCVFIGADGGPSAYSPAPVGDGVSWGVTAGQVMAQTAAWQDEQGMLHVFGIGEDLALQVIHQRGWSTTTWFDQPVELVEPIFVTAPGNNGVDTAVQFPLAASLGGFSLDPAPDAYPSQLLVPQAQGASFRIATQDVTTSWWNDEEITLFGTGGVVELQRRYVGDVTLVDGFGAPLPSWPVQLSAQSSVDVEVAGRMLRLGPTRTAHVLTDGVGKVTLRVAARGLTVPTIQLTAKGIAEGASCDVAAGVQAFLAGTAVLAAHSERLSAEQLLNAKVSTGWLVPLWHSSSASSVEAITPDVVVEACAEAFALTHGTTAGSGHRSGFLLQRANGDRVVRRELRPGESARAALGASGDVTPYLDDVSRGIREGTLEVTGFAISGVGKATIGCLAAGGVAITVEYDLLGDADASLAVEALFQLLHAGVDRLVEWLTWKLPFVDAWSTAQALSSRMGGLSPALTATASHYLEVLKSGWFMAHQEQVTDAFKTLRGQVKGMRVDSLQGLRPGSATLPAPIYQTDTLVTPQSRWYHDLLDQQEQRVPTSAKDEPDPIWGPIWRIFTESTPGEDFQVSLDAARAALLSLWDLDNSRPVSGTTIEALVDVAEGLVPQLLPLADVIIEELCSSLKWLAVDVEGILAMPVSDPDLVGSYSWFQRQAGVPAGQEKNLTVGGLGALYAAFPITGAYTTLLGVAPFPAGTMPPLTPPPWKVSSQDDTEQDDLRLTLQVLGGLARLLYADTERYLDLGLPTGSLSLAIASCELAGLTLAGYPDFGGTTSAVDAGEIAWAGWALDSLLYCLDLYLASAVEGHPLVTTYSAWQGSAFLGAIGVGQLALSGAAFAASAQADLDTERLTTSVAAALPMLTAPLRTLQSLPPDQRWAGAGLSFKVLLDSVCDVHSGITAASLAVNELVNPVHVTNWGLPPAKQGTPYTATLTAVGGYPPYSWVLEEPIRLPAGITFDNQAGSLEGTPAPGTEGQYELVLTAVDAYRPPSTSAPVTATLVVNP